MTKTLPCLLLVATMLAPGMAHAACRTYTRDIVADRHQGTVMGVACQDPLGTWHVETTNGPKEIDWAGPLKLGDITTDQSRTQARYRADRPHYYVSEPQQDDAQGLAE